MFGFRYLKSTATDYIVHYTGGQVRREGVGLAFIYYAPVAVISKVPIGSSDVPFVFEEVTADFQDVTIQGELTYRISEPKRLAGLLDFTLDTNGRYRSDDANKLNERLVREVQILARSFTQQAQLGAVLTGSGSLVDTVRQGLGQAEAVQMLGVEILGVSIVGIKPSPDMAKALQAGAREQLLREADEAMYARRNAAVEMERQIKENELNTEIAVEQKKRQVRETQMQADIAVEQQRSDLVERRVENERKEAQARGEALRATLEPLKDVDWRTLTAASAGSLDSRRLIAMAFTDLAGNADRIGTLNITPDLLEALIRDDGDSGAPVAAEPGAPPPSERRPGARGKK